MSSLSHGVYYEISSLSLGIYVKFTFFYSYIYQFKSIPIYLMKSLSYYKHSSPPLMLHYLSSSLSPSLSSLSSSSSLLLSSSSLSSPSLPSEWNTMEEAYHTAHQQVNKEFARLLLNLIQQEGRRVACVIIVTFIA